jgi:hypothetical protein
MMWFINNFLAIRIAYNLHEGGVTSAEELGYNLEVYKME